MLVKVGGGAQQTWTRVKRASALKTVKSANHIFFLKEEEKKAYPFEFSDIAEAPLTSLQFASIL